MRTLRLRRPPRSRLAVRLVGLMLVPLIGLTAQLAASAVDRSRVVQRSERIAALSDHLIRSVALGSAIVKDELPTATVLAPSVAGMTSHGLARRLGFDLAAEQAARRAATDRAAALLPHVSWVPAVMSMVERARAAVDADSTDGDVRNAGIDALRSAQETMVAEVLDQIAALTRQAGSIAGSSRLLADLRTVQTAYELSTAFVDESNAVAAKFGLVTNAGITASGIASTVSNPTVSMAVAAILYDRLARQLGREAAPAVVARYRQVQRSSTARTVQGYYAQVIDLSASREGSRLLDAFSVQQATSQQAGVLKAALEHMDALNSIVDAAGAQVSRDTVQVQRDADRAYRTALFRALLAVVAGMLGVALVSRGITGPLRQLAARARRFSAGDLTGTAVSAGPREVVAVSQAFDDAVENIRLIQEQAEALASGDTSHVSLRRRAAGHLGAAMQASVDRLTRSLEARTRLEAELRHESTHDRLTGLLNRSAALVTLEQGLARVRRGSGGIGVLQVSLDRLQAVNDSAGHRAGDAVIQRAAQSIEAAVRAQDAVARLGSDEFVVVAETESIDVLQELAQRMSQALLQVQHLDVLRPDAGSRTFPLPDGIGASIGIAITLDGQPDAADLLRNAANAVRSAKSAGGGQIALLDERLRLELDERAKITDALSLALRHGGLRLEYQPITDLHGRTVGVEALCRWNHPELGMVAPDIFIKAAEASDLILDLDRWVLAEAIRQLQVWERAGEMADTYVSVNISGRHLRGGILAPDVERALAGTGVEPRRLLIEITESVLLADLDAVAAQLRDLRATGVRVAVDDFGTGYTSIAHLQRLPIDVLKIDRSFVAAMAETRGESMVRLMIDMADVLGLRVVAEGVETTDELERLRSMGTPLIQGYLTGRPVRPDALVRTTID